MTADVIVIGAGPAGSVAALELAMAGVDVLLVEKASLPRAKTCGDALIPDSLAVLERLGLIDEVLRLGQDASGIRIYAPNGSHVDVEGRCVCVRRDALDQLLADAAVASGARLVTEAEALDYDSDAEWATTNVRVGSDVRRFRSRVVILATGASAKVLARFKLPHRSVPSAVALRGYYRLQPGVPQDLLHIWYERPVLPGYAWIFPVGDHVFNVGAGVFREPGERPNLRDLFERFRTECASAREMLEGAVRLEPETGAPLRTDLDGCAMTADRLLVTGEAIGTTFAFSGEGIGKAMETAVVAAQQAVRALDRGAFQRADLEAYESTLAELWAPKYRHYRLAQRWLRRPWVVNLVAWRAARSTALRGRLSDILNERIDPTQVLSARGLARAFVGR